MNFRGKAIVRSRATRRGKRGKQQRSGLGFPLKQAKNEKADAACAAPALFLFVFCLISSAAKSHFCQAQPIKFAVRIFPNESEGGMGRSFAAKSFMRRSIILPQNEGKTAAERAGFSPLKRSRKVPYVELHAY